MSHSLSGISGCNEDVVIVERIPADESKSIRRLHHLSGPAKLYFTHLRKTFTGPLLQARITFGAVVLLTGLMIFTSDDQNIVGIAIAGLQPEVVIRISRIPVK